MRHRVSYLVVVSLSRSIAAVVDINHYRRSINNSCSRFFVLIQDFYNRTMLPRLVWLPLRLVYFRPVNTQRLRQLTEAMPKDTPLLDNVFGHEIFNTKNSDN